MENLRYKRCGSFVVVLKVTSDDHNESRIVVNELRASYRCSRILVVDFLNFDQTQSNITSVKCDFDPKIIFRKDKTTFSKYIPTDKASGIEYFKTYEGALHKSVIPPGNNYSGMWYAYYFDGDILSKGRYDKGFPVGIHTTFKEEEVVEIEKFSDKGILRFKGILCNGVKIGKWIYYNDEGKMCCVTIYDDKKKRKID